MHEYAPTYFRNTCRHYVERAPRIVGLSAKYPPTLLGAFCLFLTSDIFKFSVAEEVKIV